MIKAVIFDFDGVIVESVDIKTRSFARLFESEGETAVKKIVDYHLDNTGVSRFEKFKYIYKYILKREISEAKFKDLCVNFSELVINEVINAPYVKGVLEFLEKNYLKYCFFVVSATPQKEIETIISKRNIEIFFKKIYGAPNNKADAVKTIIKSTKLFPFEVVYVGDALSDYNAASINAVHFIARINNNGHIFGQNLNCRKMEDFSNIDNILKDYKHG